MTTNPRDTGVCECLVDLWVHGKAFPMVPDVALVALNGFLVCFTWTRARATGVFVNGTGVCFDVTCEEEETQKE